MKKSLSLVAFSCIISFLALVPDSSARLYRRNNLLSGRGAAPSDNIQANLPEGVDDLNGDVKGQYWKSGVMDNEEKKRQEPPSQGDIPPQESGSSTSYIKAPTF